MKNNKKQVGIRINKIRKEKGMTLEEFGKLFGASKSSVLGWENGRTLPNPERLKQIAKIADMSVDELLYGSTVDKIEYVKRQLAELEKTTKHPEYYKEDDETKHNLIIETIGRLETAIVFRDKSFFDLPFKDYLESVFSEHYYQTYITNSSIIEKTLDTLAELRIDITDYFQFIATYVTEKNHQIDLVFTPKNLDGRLREELAEIIDNAFEKVSNLSNKYPDKQTNHQLFQVVIHDSESISIDFNIEEHGLYLVRALLMAIAKRDKVDLNDLETKKIYIEKAQQILTQYFETLETTQLEE